MKGIQEIVYREKLFLLIDDFKIFLREKKDELNEEEKYIKNKIDNEGIDGLIILTPNKDILIDLRKIINDKPYFISKIVAYRIFFVENK